MIVGRNMVEAVERVMGMSDAEIRLFAKHDPDIFRDVAHAAAARIGTEKYGDPPCEDCLEDGKCTMNCSDAEIRRALVVPCQP